MKLTSTAATKSNSVGLPFADVATNSRMQRPQREIVVKGDDAAFTNVDAKTVVRHLIAVALQRQFLRLCRQLKYKIIDTFYIQRRQNDRIA